MERKDSSIRKVDFSRSIITRERRASAADIRAENVEEKKRQARPLLPTRRAIFIAETQWRSGSGPKLSLKEVSTLIRHLRTRDVCMLQMFGQHRYFTSDQIAALFFPSNRSANMRLRWLTQQHLLMRWRQLEPAEGGWRRRHSLYVLAERGAAVLASFLGVERAAIVKRAWYAVEHVFHIDHSLQVNAFFTSLATTSAPLPDQGLYHWTGQDTTRQQYEQEAASLIPDGWGRYLTPSGEIFFVLEMDRGTESVRRLTAKVAAYRSYYSGRRGAEFSHVLFVAPGATREQTIRAAIKRVTTAMESSLTFWTTHTGLLEKQGTLDSVWQDDQGQRHSLIELHGGIRSGLLIEGCIGKPGWWNYRPGAGEGA